jgi:hypothetical protein
VKRGGRLETSRRVDGTRLGVGALCRSAIDSLKRGARVLTGQCPCQKYRRHCRSGQSRRRLAAKILRVRGRRRTAVVKGAGALNPLYAAAGTADFDAGLHSFQYAARTTPHCASRQDLRSSSPTVGSDRPVSLKQGLEGPDPACNCLCCPPCGGALYLQPLRALALPEARARINTASSNQHQPMPTPMPTTMPSHHSCVVLPGIWPACRAGVVQPATHARRRGGDLPPLTCTVQYFRFTGPLFSPGNRVAMQENHRQSRFSSLHAVS